MPDDTRPARAAEQDNPACNPQFRRPWAGDLVTGPDRPENPAHGTVWHADEAPVAIRHYRGTYARQRAESEWLRLTGPGRR